MSNDNAGRTGRTNGSAPMGSTVAIVVTGIALVLGFLILRKVNDNNDSGSKTQQTSQSTTATTIDPNATVAITLPPETTAPALVTTGTKVQVANASTANGAAGAMTTAVQAKNFEMAEAVTGTEKVDKTKVLYNADDPNALVVATSLATLFPGAEVVAQGLPIPTPTGNWAEGSGVLLMLGNDYAAKTLAEISGQPATGVTVPPSST
jgi:hypothetical protein